MMRLPWFRYVAPRTVARAAAALGDAAPGEAMLLAGGTDLLPNMKRRQQTPQVLIGLRGVAEMQKIRNGKGLRVGGAVTLTSLVADRRVRAGYGALWQAAAQVATPHLRNAATLGGNICLDTRCNYYDQNYEWRKAIDFCMKKDGETCWVAPSSKRCLAVSSTDTAPALIALGARVRLVSRAEGERTVAVRDLYQNDGIHYLLRRPDEVLAEVLLDPVAGWRSAYWKLRRRGSFDFPVLGAAAALRLAPSVGAQRPVVEEARIVLGAVASRPIVCDGAAAVLAGHELTDAAIAGAAEAAWEAAKPMDNTDFVYHWRKRVVREYVAYVLRDLRGDDMRAVREETARKDLLAVL